MRFCDMLKQLRKKKGLTQAQLAEVLEVSQSTVGNWESGYREPDFEMTIALSKFFAISVDELLGVTAPEKETPSAERERWDTFRERYEKQSAEEQHRVDVVLDALLPDPEANQS